MSNITINFASTSQFVILAGDTGSGKSTRSAVEAVKSINGNNVQFYSAQPRKINTVMLCQYCNVLAESKLFGYQNGDEVNIPFNAKGIFCTYGILLSKLQENSFNPIYIGLDELHEFSIEQELCLALIVKRIKDGTLTSKILLVSATLSNDEIDSYLAEFAVDKIHLGGIKHPIEERTVSTERQLLMQLEQHLLNKQRILVFLSGKGEIEQFKQLINAHILYDMETKLKDYPFHVIEAHSQVDNLAGKLEQFIGEPTLILSTDICEAGITPPSLDVVINMGKKKQVQVNSLGVNTLVEVNTSIAEDKQRKGRVGRTHPGVYYHFSTSGDKLSYPIPAIRRESIDKVQLICRNNGLSANELAFVHQPDVSKVNNADAKLIQLECLHHDLSISDIGKKVVKLPMSVELGRAFVEAEKFDCVNELIGFIAVLEVGNPWKQGQPIKRHTDKSDVLNVLLHLTNPDDNYKQSWINKIGKNIKLSIRKLTEQLGTFHTPNYQDKYEQVIKCLLYSMKPFEVLGYSRFGYQVENEQFGCISINNSSIVDVDAGDTIIGIPFQITPKNGGRPFTVLTQVSKC